jgi:DNA transformation protein and related proteins
MEKRVVTDNFRNLGPKSREWLAEIGITTFEQIEELGSVEVYRRLKAARPRDITLNMLYGLEAALMGIRWLDLPTEIKDELRRQAEED